MINGSGKYTVKTRYLEVTICAPPMPCRPARGDYRDSGREYSERSGRILRAFRVRALNTFITCCRGQRIGIFPGFGVGKSVLLSMLAANVAADVTVIGLIGERGCGVREFPPGQPRRGLSCAFGRSLSQPPTSRR
jgi:hypothetical protein